MSQRMLKGKDGSREGLERTLVNTELSNRVEGVEYLRSSGRTLVATNLEPSWWGARRDPESERGCTETYVWWKTIRSSTGNLARLN